MIKLPEKWRRLIEKDEWMESINQTIKQVEQMYDRGENIAPAKEKIFRAFEYFDPEETRVLILGQDPYNTEGWADGLAFSSQGDKLPPSLSNIYKEIENCGFEIDRSKCDLEYLAKQGVLLLNTILTIKIPDIESHKYLKWNYLVKLVVQKLSENEYPIVFMLWGEKAKNFKKYIKKTDVNLVLMSSHPVKHNFKNNKHFKIANKFLEKNGVKPIDWSNI